MQLTNIQFDILIGLILGDGCLEMNGHNARLRVEHNLKQKEYLFWLYSQFKNIVSKEPRIVASKHKKTGKIYQKWHISTLSKECFNEYYETFYRLKRKIIPQNIAEMLISPLSLAVWFMDDGYKRNDCNALRISTDAFNLEEQQRLAECLKINFSLDCKIHKKASAWNIYIPQKDAGKFCDLINPYCIPSMKYKIKLA